MSERDEAKTKTRARGFINTVHTRFPHTRSAKLSGSTRLYICMFPSLRWICFNMCLGGPSVIESRELFGLRDPRVESKMI